MRVWNYILIAGLATIGYILFLRRLDISETEPYRYVEEPLVSEAKDIIQRTSDLLKFPTVNPDNNEAFEDLINYVKSSYPRLHEKVPPKRINKYSLLYVWKGSDATLNPLVLLSHSDVVPESGQWTHGPFSGAVDGGYLYGRGALDTKLTLAAILEAVEQLIAEKYDPRRTLIIAFGHDEESEGGKGAKAIAEYLEADLGIKEVELVVDEGGALFVDGLKPLTYETPIALVGIGEKGFQMVVITVHGVAGHSSAPPTGMGSSVASRLAKLLDSLERVHMTTNLAAPTTDMLQAIAPLMPWSVLRFLAENSKNGILNPILGQVMATASTQLAALVRTTCAVVKIEAGTGADNVLPDAAVVRMNCRILPGDTQKDIGTYIATLLHSLDRTGKSYTFKLEEKGVALPPAVADAHGPHYELVRRAVLESISAPVNEHHERVSVAPWLLTGLTDSRYYSNLAKGRVYRFSPMFLNRTAQDIERIHGIDERVSVENVLQAVKFFLRLIKLATSEHSLADRSNNRNSSEPHYLNNEL